MTVKSKNSLVNKDQSILKMVYSENETDNYSSKTGKRYEHYNNGLRKNPGYSKSPQDSNVRHFSVNDAHENTNLLKNELWKQFEHQRGSSNNENNASLLDAKSPLEDNRMDSDEDNENLLELYFRDNTDSIINDNECLIPLEALPKTKSKNQMKRKRATLDETKPEMVPMMYDEYIPDMDFINNFQRMQEYYELNPTFDDELEALPKNKKKTSTDKISSLYKTGSESSFGNLMKEVIKHSNVDPVAIKQDSSNEIKRYDASTISESNSFLDVNKLPESFESMPYSQRKKILVDICPGVDIKDILLELKTLNGKGRHGSSTSLYTLQSRNDSSYNDRVNSLMKSYDSQQMTPKDSTLKSSKDLVVMGYKLRKIIGQGAWGVIRECINTDDSADIKAVKIVKYKGNASVKLSVIQEVKVWKTLKHKNILALVDYKQGENAMFCLMERIHGGTLYDYVAKKWYNNEQQYPLNVRGGLIIDYLLQIISGLTYMHKEMGVVHGDMKLENVLISENNKVVLCDFGMTKYLPKDQVVKRPDFKKYNSCGDVKYHIENESNTTVLRKIINNKKKVHDDTSIVVSSFDENIGPAFQSASLMLEKEKTSLNETLSINQIGSLPYAAPELLDKKNLVTEKTDIWALGVMIYTMCVYKLPFQHEFEPRLKVMIEKAVYDHKMLTDIMMKNYPSLCFVVEGCLNKSIEDRWSLEKIERNLKY